MNKHHLFSHCCVVLIVSGLAAGVGCSKQNTELSDSDQPILNDSIWPKLESPIPTDDVQEQRINALLAQMRLEDKIGQMIQGEIGSVTPADVKQYRLGSVLNGGGSWPNNDKYAKPADWLALADGYYHASMDTRQGGVAIPIIWGTDAVHGHNNLVGATLFPHNIGLGAANDPSLVEKIAEATAMEVSATGIDWIFAPTLAVAQDDRWGRTYESFSENPEVIALYAEHVVRGLQGAVNSRNFLNEQHTLATAKHFLGDGGTDQGVDQGDNNYSEQQLRDVHAAGYFPALTAGVQTVMASYNSWQGEKLHGHHYLLTDVLKTQLGFDGFVIGDWNGHSQVTQCDNTQCAQAINAGIDMIMAPQDWKSFYKNTLKQAQDGEISLQRIDDAVRRILRVKLRAGLFEKGPPSSRQLTNQPELIGNRKHRALAREAARKSLVLLKNDEQILPLSRQQTVAVIGDAANSLEKQTGGWTVSWQGSGNKREDYSGATTIADGIRAAVLSAGGQVIVSETGEGIENADVVIAVIGEAPYAEMRGDIATFEHQPGNKIDLALLKKFAEKNIPVVTVLLSGRPLWVNPELNQSQAFVAAWLPGSEGQAIADVLFKTESGDINFDFKGKLPFSWPKKPDHGSNYHGPNSMNKDYDPQFPWGYGLTYKDRTVMGNNLSDAGMALSPNSTDRIVLLDHEAEIPWQLFMQEEGSNPIKIENKQPSGLMQSIQVTQIDNKPGAYSAQWTGQRNANIHLAVRSPINFASYEAEGVLEFSIRLNDSLPSQLSLGMGCGENCGGNISIDGLLNAKTGNNWNTFDIALNCFAEEGMQLDRTLTGLSITSDQKTSVNFSSVTIRKTGAAKADLNCR